MQVGASLQCLPFVDSKRVLQEAEAGAAEEGAAGHSDSAAGVDCMLLEAGRLLLSSLGKLAARAAGSAVPSSASFAELVAGTADQGAPEHAQRSSDAAGLRHQLLAREKVRGWRPLAMCPACC